MGLCDWRAADSTCPATVQFPDDQKQRYIAFFDEVVVRTARLVAHWQCVGFVHGVLNTGTHLPDY
jgi:uncharacterized protein YdiU (UPF0061 family)